MKAAIYARFSTSQQSGSSIPDQFRVCERLACQHGFTVVARFEDAAISGGTIHRPGYQAMLEAARRHDFGVIVAEDTSRLWRLLAEQSPRLAELADLGIHIVTHDLDTRQESAAILGAVNGAMAEAYRREIARRTRRGLEGRARQQKHTGGKAYGFDGLAVIPEQAKIVLEIFTRYGAGETLRAIARDLNRRGIPSPGSAWNRRERATDGKWRVSALHALLRNERYVGQVIWNRSRWVRSASDSKSRRRVENPRSDWIVHDGPKVISDALWSRCQARMVTGYASPKARPRYLLSGLLECGICGRKMVITGGKGHRYICGNRHTGVGCDNDLGVPRDLAEALILQPIMSELLDPANVKAQVKRMRQMAPPVKADPRLAEIKRLVSEGVLSQAEAAPALERLKPVATVEPNWFAAADVYREVVTELRESLNAEDVAAARPLLRDLIGPITAVPSERDGKRCLVAHFPAFEGVAALVAGARFVRTVSSFPPIELRRCARRRKA